MAVESSQCLLQELRDPKKAMSDHLSSTDGKFSWGQTTEEEHQACVGKMTTNDAAESSFVALTSQLQTFGGLLTPSLGFMPLQLVMLERMEIFK